MHSLMEAKLVGINDAMLMIMQTHHFLEAQGYDVKDNVMLQDNESTMKLSQYGKQASGQ